MPESSSESDGAEAPYSRDELWAKAGDLASPNFHHQGEYYSKARYYVVDGKVLLRDGVPHGSPQADRISAEVADAMQRKIFGHLRRLQAESLRAGGTKVPESVYDASRAPEAEQNDDPEKT